MQHPYQHLIKELDGYKYFSIAEMTSKLPYSIRILLEQAIRNCDGFNVKEQHVDTIRNWHQTSKQDIEVPFKPARVLLQDFTGVPLLVDLAAMRHQTSVMGKDPKKINPLCPVELVIDHSVQVDHYGSENALEKNEETEFARNYERFEFLKWSSKAFQNISVVPPGSGIVHQVNLEYLARVVFKDNGMLYPDSVVGTDSHTTMINGLGVLGWGVGGIEAEANMLGEVTAMVLPQVVGFKLVGKLNPIATATDLVLKCTEMLRQKKVVGKYVEFYGAGVKDLSLADRATISNMAPEYGATMGYFPIDEVTMQYLRQTGRSDIEIIEKYLKVQNLWVSGEEVEYSDTLELDLGAVEPCLAGPKRPQDRVNLKDLPKDFKDGLSAPVSFKGYNADPNGNHGRVVIAAITSCTNTSNPGVMLMAGLLAKKAVEKGLTRQSYVKTSLSPGSQVVTRYYEKSQLLPFLQQLGFHIAGYGCMTCIGNSGDLDEEVVKSIGDKDIVCAVLSGNRNFEGRTHPLTRANYLASPPLVVAYALAGRIDIDFDKEPIANGVYLKDIWPSKEEVAALEASCVTPDIFQDVYNRIKQGTKRWNEMKVEEGALLYKWNEASTYIHHPPYFQGLTLELPPFQPINDVFCLANFGDSITTDHISPAGNISLTSSAAKYLLERGVEKKDFNTYGARRGNDEIMVRGTFANVRLKNKMVGKEGPFTVHVPSKQQMSPFEASQFYKEGSVILGGAEYGSGSSRDWAAKGPYLQGVRAVIVISYERIHRSNLAGMGVLPLQFINDENADKLGLTGFEKYTIAITKESLKVNQIVDIVAKKDDGAEVKFQAKVRLDTDVEIQYYLHGGILQYVLRKILSQ